MKKSVAIGSRAYLKPRIGAVIESTSGSYLDYPPKLTVKRD